MDIYRAEVAWAAQMLRDVLESHGITAHVRESSTGFHRHPLFVVFIIDPAAEPRAREIVSAFRENASADATDERAMWKWRCPRCGEDIEPQFEQCWNCQTPKPARE